MSTDAQAMEALANIERELAPAQRGQEKLDLPNLCQQYKKVKALLEIALPFIERIPVYGQKIGVAVRFLMKMADIACPV